VEATAESAEQTAETATFPIVGYARDERGVALGETGRSDRRAGRVAVEGL
jgi:hypothetical protein